MARPAAPIYLSTEQSEILNGIVRSRELQRFQIQLITKNSVSIHLPL